MKHLTRKYFQIRRDIDNYIEKYVVKKGDVVKWQHGKYKGRPATVRHVSWDEEWGISLSGENKLQITVVVTTHRLDGTGFIDDNDSYHRVYRTFDKSFIKPAICNCRESHEFAIYMEERK